MKGKEDSFKDFVLDQLQSLEELVCKAMFGGFGIYCNQVFFGIIHQGRLYFCTDESTRGEYQSRGMKPFKPSAKQTLKNYYEVPVEVIEDRDELTRWTLKAVAVKNK